jgi:hypothetical protein
MKSRPPRCLEPEPAHLTTYRPDDWPSISAWRRARLCWHAEHRIGSDHSPARVIAECRKQRLATRL